MRWTWRTAWFSSSAALMKSLWSDDSSTKETTTLMSPGGLGQLQEARVVATHGDLGVEVLQQVAGQAQLGEDDEVRLLRPGLGDELVVTREVRPRARRGAGRSGPGRRGVVPWPECMPREARVAAAQYVSTRTGVSAKSLTLRVRTAASMASGRCGDQGVGKTEAVATLVCIPSPRAGQHGGLWARLDELDRFQECFQTVRVLSTQTRAHLAHDDLVDERLVAILEQQSLALRRLGHACKQVDHEG